MKSISNVLIMMVATFATDKKKNFFFNLVAVMSILTLTVTGCTSLEEKSQKGCVEEWCFYVNIENASKYSNVAEVKVMVYDRTTSKINSNDTVFVDCYDVIARGEWKDGGFAIALPETLAPNHLRALIHGGSNSTNIEFLQSTMNISSENVKVADAYFVGVDKDGKVVATFSPVMKDEDGYSEAIFTYFDSDVIISGFTEVNGHAIPAYEDAPNWFEKTTNYSVKLKKLWNVWFFSSYRTKEGDTMIIKEQWSNNPVNGLKWYGSENNLFKFEN